MSNTTLKPGLVVNELMFKLAANKVVAIAPELPPITREQFNDPTNWLLVPNPDGFGYKAEYVVLRTEARTIKINIWMAPDLRDGQKAKPHNHPWEDESGVSFIAYVLYGGYTEARYFVIDGQVQSEVVHHTAGGQNVVYKNTFHEVISLDELGTLSVMDCGPGIMGDWGYIDPDTGDYSANDPAANPNFREQLLNLNPHMRK